MPHKTVLNVVSVWLTTAFSWIVAITTDEWLQSLSLIKEIIGILSLLIAIAYTLYKFKKDWKGFNPKKK